MRCRVMMWGVCVLLLVGQAVAWGADEAERILSATPAAVMIGSTAMVPLQPMAELLGGTMTVQGTAVEFTLEDAQLAFTMGSYLATARGKIVALPVPPFERAGVVYVPLRALITGVGGMLSMDTEPHRTLAQVPTSAGRVDLHLRETRSYPMIEAYDDYDSELYVCNPDGSGVQRLTYNTGDNPLAGVSPDGRSLAYAYASQLCMRAFNDPQEWALAPWVNGEFASAPTFSPDSSSVLFVRYTHRTASLETDKWMCSVKTDGTCYRELGQGETARYAPDGKFIAFLHEDANDVTKIYRMNPDGSQVRTLDEVREMAFSSDGRYLHYTVPLSDSQAFSRTLSVPSGKRLPDGPAFSTANESAEYTISPDLTTVVFTALETGEIHLTDINRTHVTSLTSGRIGRKASFAPDLSHILFLRDFSLYSVERDGSHLRPLIANVRIYDYAVTPDGAHIIFSAAPEAMPLTK